MGLDGAGFHVETEVLEAASRSMGEIVSDQDDFELRGLCGDPEVYGHGGIHDALAEFCGSWSVGLDALCDRSRHMSDSLADAAKAYRGVDQNTARTMAADPGLDAVTPSPPPMGSDR
jgi:hypothetical protein